MPQRDPDITVATEQLIGDLGPVFEGEQTPYDVQPATTEQKGLQSYGGYQGTIDIYTSGVLEGFKDEVALCDLTVEIGSGFAQIAFVDLGGSQVLSQGEKYYYPGESGLAVPAGGQLPSPNNLTFWWAQPKGTMITAPDGLEYPELEIVTTLPSDYPERIPPPDEHRTKALLGFTAWALTIPSPPCPIPGPPRPGLVLWRATPRPLANTSGWLLDMVSAMGPWRDRGGRITPGTAGGKKIRFESATWFVSGANLSTDLHAPSTRTTTVADGGLMSTAVALGDGEFGSSGFPPSTDLNTVNYGPAGISTPIPDGKWVIHTVYESADLGGHRVILGEVLYDSRAEVMEHATAQTKSQVWATKHGAQMPIGVIAVKSGATLTGDTEQCLIWSRTVSFTDWELSTPFDAPRSQPVRQDVYAPVSVDRVTRTSTTAGAIVYLRIWLDEGIYTEMETMLGVGRVGEEIDLGVYADVSGSPSGPLLTSTGAVDSGGADDAFFRQPLITPLDVSANGSYYWLGAMITSVLIRLIITDDQLPQALYAGDTDGSLMAVETGSPASLPDPVGTLDAASSFRMPYVGILRS